MSAPKRYQPNPAWAEHVRKLVDSAPPLSPAQVSRLAILLSVSPPAAPQKRKSTDENAAA